MAEAEFTAPDQPIEALVETIAATLRAAEPRTAKSGKPETVIFEWKIVDPKEDDPPPQGEVAAKPTEGVEPHSALHPDPSAPPTAGGSNPLSPCGTAPPEGEHPPPRRRWPYGLPGEFGPNGETGEDPVIGVI